MSAYQHILLALDISEDAMHVGERAAEIARSSGAKITVLHVVDEPKIERRAGWAVPVDMGAAVPRTPTGHVPPVIETALEEPRRAVELMVNRLGLANADPLVVVASSIKGTIHEVAKDAGADLIVVGSHGRHGLALLFSGSTANSVLHDAPCDVLAVRVKD